MVINLEYVQQYEEQLISNWVTGKNLDSIGRFEKFLCHNNILQAIKSMEPSEVNQMNVAEKANIKSKVIFDMAVDYNPALYDSSLIYLLKAYINNKINTATSKQEIADALKEWDNIEFEGKAKETDLVQAYKNELQRRRTADPLKYGIPKLDKYTGGLHEGEFTVIAARPSIGKTALAMQVAHYIATRGERVMFFPLEMTGSQIMERIVCGETNVPHESLKTPKLITDEQMALINNFFENYGKYNKDKLIVIEKVSKLSDIRKNIEKYKPRAVFIDQLSQLKENRKFNSMREQFSYMTNTLKAMALELNIPIVLMAQINRDAQNCVPTLANLKESGSIEEDSDNVIMLHQTGEATSTITPISIIIRKQRNGIRDVEIECSYINKNFQFMENTR